MHKHSKWLLCPAFVLAITFMLGGCVANTAGQMTLTRDLYSQATYFVEHQPKDTHDLDAIIAERMRARGLKATSGSAGGEKPEHDYVVTYTDKWMWDMRMYLWDLRIDVRDAKDNSIVGFGQSMQSSLVAMGKTYADVIDTALGELFGPR
jgi:hypothetical protein